MTRYDRFEPTKQERQAFDCGEAELNEWLVRFAGQAMAARDAAVTLLHDDRRIIGFFTLSAGSVSRHIAGRRLAKRAPDPVPMILLGRMATDLSVQGQGFGAELLRRALLAAEEQSRTLGARGLFCHAINDDARAFYLHHGFEESPVMERHLMISFKDLLASAPLPD